MKRYLFESIKISSQLAEENLIKQTVEAFIKTMNPTEDEICKIATAIFEAVQNASEFAYPNSDGIILIKLIKKADNQLEVKIQDWGIGIKDITKARENFFTTGSNEEHSGLGFAVMEKFMDKVLIKSSKKGTIITMKKKISS